MLFLITMRKVIVLFLLAVGCITEILAGYTDSFDVKHYDIQLEVRNFAARTIKGNANVTMVSKINGLSKVFLHLLKLQVQNTSVNGTPVTPAYNDTILTITLPTPKNTGDTFVVSVQYQGIPRTDAYFGGFYFSGNYAYNLGVAFNESPHTFGRSWFPCLDTFTSRSTYRFEVTTDGDKRAMCNGKLTNTINNFDGSITWVWEMNTRIPTYLASVAVAPYAVLTDSYTGLSGNNEITLACLPGDTAKMLASFIHLKNAIAAFEKWYGPHRFDRVGYSVVPFNGGAMEHPTNIAYPLFAVDGLLTFETLYAHELAHHWWGDNTTCRTGEDMWLNEGWASYSERLFLEEVYGKARYKADILANHYDVLRWAHLQDGRPWPVSGVPHKHTYGRHVYNKGADMVHTLRGYMGDAAFMAGAKDFQQKKTLTDVSSEDLKNILQPHTSANLTAFFNNWIYEQGFPAFSAYIVKTDFVQGKYNCTVKVHQQLRFTDKLYTGVPLKIHFVGATGGDEVRDITLNRQDTTVVFSLPINPVMVAVDRDELLSDAVTDEERWVKDTNVHSFYYALLDYKLSKTAADSILIRAEHHWTAPVTGTNPYPGLFVSGNRYWKIDGSWTDTLLDGNLYFDYAGNTPGGYTSGWLDNDLIKQTEDSLRLLYRKNPGEPWEIYPYYTHNTGGNKLDKVGLMYATKIRKGEYVLAMYDKKLGTITITPQDKGKLDIYPNPSQDKVKIEFDDVYNRAELTITDNLGRIIQQIPLYSGQKFIEVDTNGWAAGVYFVNLSNGLGRKLVVE